HVVTLATEHKCVIESVARLEREGHEVTVLGVDRDGFVDLAALDQAVTERTAVVSIMAANNEIGVIQPLAEIGALCRARGGYFHSDAAQALGKIPLDVNAMQIDLPSIPGHKLYGPKGVGALYVRRRPRVRLEPMMDGGGQERGLRSGTLAPALCVGLGMACRIAAEDMTEEARRITALRDRLVERLREGAGPLTINGAMDHRLEGNLNVAFDGVPAHALIEALPQLALSTGSACTSASVEPSYVLRALGVEEATAARSLRISIGRFNTAEEIDAAGRLLVAAVIRLRQAQTAAAQ
ncbi:MAG: aminotransferase class V-fold PLP-dependent enzyme, partial [Cytophagales bacterium]|nr:aminotransferase class V-fold PLP-dependent enzyme [Cytophagales bacterium]